MTDEDKHLAIGEETLLRLVLPTGALLLAIAYVNSVHGRISMANLRYPYFVIAILIALTMSIYFEEFIALYRIRNEEDRPSFTDSIIYRIKDWKRAIGLALSGILYLWLIDPLGFFLASAFLLVSVMFISGVRNYIKVSVISTLVLISIYVVFVHLLNMSPPEGLFEELIQDLGQ